MADSPYIVEVTDASFAQEVLERSYQVPVLVDFWAEWCQPCKMLMPTLAKIAEDYAGKFILAKINTEEQQQVASQFGIRSIPTVKLFRNGEVVDEFAGALPEGSIRDFINQHIPRESDALIDQALDAMDQEDLESAEPLLVRVTAEDPENYRVILANAQLKMLRTDFDAAEQLLDALPMDKQDDPEAKQLRAQLPFIRAVSDAPEEAELLKAAEAGDSQSTYQLAAMRIFQQDFEQALELLLGLMRKDRKFGDDAARKGMLAIFDMLGGDGELVKRYRGKMFALLH
jgi:putative thioredoxin